MKILFLYTELADYTLACLKALENKGADFRVIHYPVNAEAPFAFGINDDNRFTNIRRFSNYASFALFCDEYGPEKIVCSGWVNKWYLRYCRRQRNRTTTILTLDNHWSGSLKQRMLSVVSRLTIVSTFRFAWVPGKMQKEYARKLGFPEGFIKSGFYSCDVDYFSDQFRINEQEKARQFPHKFLCVARYIPTKGYDDLWSAFAKWKNATDNDWELWCAGTGEGFDSRQVHPAIHHLGFVQKDRWNDVIKGSGVFVLPSRFEPWGVVVHEFASSGFPLILSSAVGAATEFLTPENGFSFPVGQIEQLIRVFDKISGMSDSQLFEMGKESNRIAFKITPDKWASGLLCM